MLCLPLKKTNHITTIWHDVTTSWRHLSLWKMGKVFARGLLRNDLEHLSVKVHHTQLACLVLSEGADGEAGLHQQITIPGIRSRLSKVPKLPGIQIAKNVCAAHSCNTA